MIFLNDIFLRQIVHCLRVSTQILHCAHTMCPQPSAYSFTFPCAHAHSFIPEVMLSVSPSPPPSLDFFSFSFFCFSVSFSSFSRFSTSNLSLLSAPLIFFVFRCNFFSSRFLSTSARFNALRFCSSAPCWVRQIHFVASGAMSSASDIEEN